MLTFFRTQVLPHRVTQLLMKTFIKWQKDQCLEMGAALSYYGLFSLFPIVLVITSVVGFLLGPESHVFEQVLAFVHNAFPPQAVTILENTLLHLNQRSIEAGIIGFFLMFFTASSVFGALDRSVDKIWKATDEPVERSTLVATAWSFFVKKLLAFGLVIFSAVLLTLALLSNVIIRIIISAVENMDQAIPLIHIDNFWIQEGAKGGISIFLIALTILLLFRILPSTFTPWRDLWPSTLLTTAMLVGLQQLVSHSIIEVGSQFRSYGVIGSVMILMMWMYLTCQVFLLGCEFAYVYAHLFGSRQHHDLQL